MLTIALRLLLICCLFKQITFANNKMDTKNIKSIQSNPCLSTSLGCHHKITKKISLNLQNVPVRSALKIIAQLTKTNIIISDDVNGYITLYLHNLPWQEVLHIILTTQNLTQHKIDGVIVIGPTDKFIAQAKKKLQATMILKSLQPLINKAFQIKYGRAENYYTTLKNTQHTLLSSRGTIILNKRTNTIFVNDTAKRLMAIKYYIITTDIPLKQVEIAARIVTINKSFERQLGIKWDLRAKNTIHTIDAIQENGFKLDFSATNIGTVSPSSITLTALTNNVLIGLELSALEAAGGGEILSSPRLITADQQTAVIEQGTEIPYNEATKSGAAAITFRRALLRLKVTPQITPHNKILLHLEVNQDAKSTDTSAGNTPIIDTRHISTNVLVDNGETIILGGIYEHSKNRRTTRVPFISSIPLLGKLFRQHDIKEARKELLIFVTPHIINRKLNIQVMKNGK